MKPIGLTFKNIKTNVFTERTSGELMVIHQCLRCKKISCNRIAGDDNTVAIISLLDEADNLDIETKNELRNKRINLLSNEDKNQVNTSLFGYF